MTRTLATGLCGLIAAGCGKVPPEAPKELDQLSAYLFANFESESGEELVAGTEEMRKFLKKLDLGSNKIDDRAFFLSPLQEEDWGGIQGPASENAADQLPVGVGGASPNAIAKHKDLVGEKNHVCIDSNTTVWYRREWITDKGCFLDGSCDTLETINEIRKESLVADVWYDMYKDYRTVELEDETEAMIARSWTEDVFLGDGGNNSWDQQYGLDMWIPEGKATLRYFVFWSAVTISGIGDDFYIGLVKSGIDEGFENADNFISGDKDCGRDRDEQFTRP